MEIKISDSEKATQEEEAFIIHVSVRPSVHPSVNLSVTNRPYIIDIGMLEIVLTISNVAGMRIKVI